MIDYSKSYILFKVKASTPFVNGDTENIVKDAFTLRNSDDIITDIKIILNNIVISDEVDIYKANLVNFILRNSNTNKSIIEIYRK